MRLSECTIAPFRSTAYKFTPHFILVLLVMIHKLTKFGQLWPLGFKAYDR